jgi:uncharacterized protein
MKLNKLSLKDQKLFNRYLNYIPGELSAFSFANIYIWKSLYDVNWALVDHSLCIFFHDALGCFMYLPPLAKNKVSQVCLAEAFALMEKSNQHQRICRIENITQAQTDDYLRAGYLIREKYPDYLCLRSDLEHLTGNKFKSQRAAYNYFIKHYDYAVSPLKPGTYADCLVLFDSWVKERKAANRDAVYCGMLEDNYKVIRVALNNYKPLHFEGIVVRVDKKIKGFSFGYKLNSHTFCVLYEITDLSVKGLAQFIFRQFCSQLKDYKYINIMDDSGLKNLARTKLAYKPVRLVSAYIATKE